MSRLVPGPPYGGRRGTGGEAVKKGGLVFLEEERCDCVVENSWSSGSAVCILLYTRMMIRSIKAQILTVV